MPEGTNEGHSDWSERIDRLLSGTGGEQLRQLIDEVRAGLEHVSGTMKESLSGATAGMGEAVVSVRSEVEGLRAQMDALGERIGVVDAMREDLVRSLEAVAAAQRQTGEGQGVDVDAIESVVQSQAERIIGGFAQRVGQIQNAIFEVRDSLTERIQQIERNAPPMSPLTAEDVARAVVDAMPAPQALPETGGMADTVVDALRKRLDDIEVSIRTDIDAGFRQRSDSDTKQVDALGLRITNMSMSVSQALDSVRAQVDSMTERGRSLEAEQAAILEAIREQVSGLAASIGHEVATRTSDTTRQISDTIASMGASVSDRIAALEGPLRGAAEASAEIGSLAQRLSSLDEIKERIGRPDERLDALEDIKAAVATPDKRLDALASIGSKLDVLDEIKAGLGALSEIKDAVATSDPRLDSLDGLEGLDERVAARLEASLAPIGELRAEVGDLSEVAIKLGALPGIEEQLAAIGRAAAAVPSMSEKLDGLSRIDERLGALDEIAAVSARIRDDIAVLPSIREQLRALAEVDDESVTAELARLGRAIGGFDARLGGLADHLAVVDDLRASLTKLRTSVADGVTVELAQIRSRLGALPDDEALEARLAGFSARLDAGIEQMSDKLGALDDLRAQLGALTEISSSVDAVRSQVAALPDAEALAAGAASSIAEPFAELGARVDALAPLIDANGPRLDSMASTLSDGLAAMREQLAGVDTVREAVRSLVEAADAEGSKIAEAGSHMEQVASSISEEMQRALSRLGVRLDGIESAVARTIIDVRQALDDVRQGSEGVVEQLGGRLGDLADKVASLDDATGSVRSHLAALPGPSEISSVVAQDVGAAISSARSSTEGRLDGVERELASIASNINEIWMRVRGVVQGVDTLGTTLSEQAETAERRAVEASEGLERVAKRGERLERLLAEVDARNDERLSRRVAELEARVVAAGRAIETERDRLFLQAFDEMVERVSRGDRKLGKRLRGLVGFRRAADEEQFGLPERSDVSSENDPPTQPVSPVEHGEPTVTTTKPSTKKTPKPAPTKKTATRPRASKTSAKASKTSPKRDPAKKVSKKTGVKKSPVKTASAARATTRAAARAKPKERASAAETPPVAPADPGAGADTPGGG